MVFTHLFARLRKINVRSFALWSTFAAPALSSVPSLSSDHLQAEKQQYLQTIECNPQDDEPHHRLALLLFEMGDRHGAEEHLRSAIQLNPRSAATHFDLGTLLRATGRITEAELEFKQAWQLEPLVGTDRW